jgi:membrane protease YdiL (CAAX protease family)
MAIASILAIDFITEFVMPKSWLQDIGEYTEAAQSSGAFLNILLVALLAPFTEEVLYRGLITGRLLGHMPRLLVVAIPVFLFGFSHASGGVGQIVGTAITGLIFTLVFLWTNSLRASVLTHVVCNSTGFFLTPLYDLSVPLRIAIGVVACALTLFLAYMICKRRDKEIAVVSIDS